MHFDPGLVDRVFPSVGRNHSAHFVGSALTRQISALHHDPRDGIDYRDRLCPQRSFPVG